VNPKGSLRWPFFIFFNRALMPNDLNRPRISFFRSMYLAVPIGVQHQNFVSKSIVEMSACGRVLLFTLRKFTPDEGLLCVAKRL